MLAPVTRGRAPCWTRTWRLSSASGGLFPLPRQRWGESIVYAARRMPKSRPRGDDKHASAQDHGLSELRTGSAEIMSLANQVRTGPRTQLALALAGGLVAIAAVAGCGSANGSSSAATA